MNHRLLSVDNIKRAWIPEISSSSFKNKSERGSKLPCLRNSAVFFFSVKRSEPEAGFDIHCPRKLCKKRLVEYLKEEWFLSDQISCLMLNKKWFLKMIRDCRIKTPFRSELRDACTRQLISEDQGSWSWMFPVLLFSNPLWSFYLIPFSRFLHQSEQASSLIWVQKKQTFCQYKRSKECFYIYIYLTLPGPSSFFVSHLHPSMEVSLSLPGSNPHPTHPAETVHTVTMDWCHKLY